MSESSEYPWSLQSSLGNCLGSEDEFRRWLEILEMQKFAPGTKEELGCELFRRAGPFTYQDHSPDGTSPDEILNDLERRGVDWSQAIRQALAQAETKWPTVADSHSALLDRIKKVWL